MDAAIRALRCKRAAAVDAGVAGVVEDDDGGQEEEFPSPQWEDSVHSAAQTRQSTTTTTRSPSPRDLTEQEQERRRLSTSERCRTSSSICPLAGTSTRPSCPRRRRSSSSASAMTGTQHA